MNIRVKFLGNPEIYFENTKVEIQQKKIQALFLYLLFNESCTRDELTSVFWCEYDEESARRNLRNSIYKLKSIIDKDIITTKGNTYIQINPEFNVSRDIDIFITENSEVRLLEMNEFVFLDKFYINHCIEFEKWVTSITNVYEKMLVDRLRNGLKNSIKANDTRYIEEFSKKIILIDPCNEPAYRSLMNICVNRGSYNEAIRLYKSLEKHLREELDIEPEEETSELLKNILGMQKIKDVGHENINIYYGRMRESLSIIEEYRKFICSEDFSSCIVCGEIGDGKTKVIDSFLDSERIKDFLEVEFKLPNKSISYYAIEKIIDGLMQKYNIDIYKNTYQNCSYTSLYYLKLMECIMDYMHKHDIRELVVLKNIESIDDESFDIILSVLLNEKSKKIFVVGEYCQSFKPDYSIITKLEVQSSIKLIRLSPLDKHETASYVNMAAKNSPNTNTNINILIDNIYKNTRGNLMLLNDILDQIDDREDVEFKLKKNSMNKIKDMLTSFSSDEVEYLERLSVFENGVEIDVLADISGESTVKVLDIIDRLYKRGFMAEKEIENHTVIKIKSKLIRDIVYNSMKSYKTAEFHKIIANFYKAKYLNQKKDYFYISELQYHFNFTNDEYEKLYWNLVYLEYRLDYFDEFFPTLKNLQHSPTNFYLKRENIYKEFEAYAEMMNSINNLLNVEKLYEIKMRFNFLMGRTLSRDGKKEKGIYYINELIEQARKLNRNDFLLKGYMEKIYYGLKTDNIDLMNEYIEKANKIEDIDRYQIEKGILFRLEGLSNIMNNDYKKAEDSLWKSIDLFYTHNLSCTNFINIAAAYDYLGYSYRKKGEYDYAEKYLKKAIDICLEKNIKKSLDLFYEDLGYVFFLKGQYDEAEKYFEKSIELYDMFGTYWLRSIGESCMSLIHMHRGNIDKSLEHFRRAEIFSKKDSVKEELEVLESARKQLKEHQIL